MLTFERKIRKEKEFSVKKIWKLFTEYGIALKFNTKIK